jgi:hypothetical protein
MNNMVNQALLNKVKLTLESIKMSRVNQHEILECIKASNNHINNQIMFKLNKIVLYWFIRIEIHINVWLWIVFGDKIGCL